METTTKKKDSQQQKRNNPYINPPTFEIKWRKRIRQIQKPVFTVG